MQLEAVGRVVVNEAGMALSFVVEKVMAGCTLDDEASARHCDGVRGDSRGCAGYQSSFVWARLSRTEHHGAWFGRDQLLRGTASSSWTPIEAWCSWALELSGAQLSLRSGLFSLSVLWTLARAGKGWLGGRKTEREASCRQESSCQMGLWRAASTECSARPRRA